MRRALHEAAEAAGRAGGWQELRRGLGGELRRLTMEEFGEACLAVGHGLSSDSELRSEFAAAGAPGEVLLFEDFCGWCAYRHVGAGFADSDEEDIEASAHY